MHASAWLSEPDKHPPTSVIVVYGNESYLRQKVLHLLRKMILGDDASDEMSFSRYEGEDLDLATVLDELNTISMWGDRRLVMVDDADSFVTAHRSGLEKYVQKPSRQGVLLLTVNKWMKTTKLAKAVEKSGLPIECGGMKGAELSRWAVQHAKQEYDCQLTREAATLLIQLAGEGLSLLDQELSKLASYTGDSAKIGAEDVEKLVGGWRMETTWAMTDAIQAGNAARALELLGQMLDAGEAPQKLMGGVSFVFRKLAAATEMASGGMNLQAALRKAGVFPKSLPSSEDYLRRVGRPEAEQILSRLVTAETRLRSTSGLATPRLIVELLILELTGAPAAAARR